MVWIINWGPACKSKKIKSTVRVILGILQDFSQNLQGFKIINSKVLRYTDLIKKLNGSKYKYGAHMNVKLKSLNGI